MKLRASWAVEGACWGCPLLDRPLTDYPFWTSSDVCPWFQSKVYSLTNMLPHLCAMDSSDSPLVQHVVTSLWSVQWASHFNLCNSNERANLYFSWCSELKLKWLVITSNCIQSWIHYFNWQTFYIHTHVCMQTDFFQNFQFNKMVHPWWWLSHVHLIVELKLPWAYPAIASIRRF